MEAGQIYKDVSVRDLEQHEAALISISATAELYVYYIFICIHRFQSIIAAQPRLQSVIFPSGNYNVSV